MGCLRFIFRTIIAVLVFFGLLHLGVIDFIKDKIDEHKSGESQEKIIEDTKDMVDLSSIDSEYAIEKNLKVLKNRMIIAEHNATSQKMIMIEPRSGNILTKDDITSENVQETIETTLKKYKYLPVKFENIEVTKKSNFRAFEQNVPYVKVSAEIANLPMKDVEGILGVAELENGKNLIIISVNEKGKYSQIIADAFYKQVK